MPSTSDESITRLPVEVVRIIILHTMNNAPMSLPSPNICFNWKDKIADIQSWRRVSRRPICRLARASYQLWDIASEFIYSSLYIRSTEHAHTIVSCPLLLEVIAKWTQEIIVSPNFPEKLSRPVFHSNLSQFAEGITRIFNSCTRLRTIILRIDTVSRIYAEFDQWKRIFRAIPPGVHILDLDDNASTNPEWEPLHILTCMQDSSLHTLRTSAVAESHELSFPKLVRLSLHSWTIASKWNLPNLKELSLEYLPNFQNTNIFWSQVRGTLETLHFGYATDLTTFPDLARQIKHLAPNLVSLEYYYFGMAEVPWDPRELPKSVKSVTVKLFHHWNKSSPDRAGLQMEFPRYNVEPTLSPQAHQKWAAFASHMSRYDIQVNALVPQNVNLEHLQSVVEPILRVDNARVRFTKFVGNHHPN